MKDEEMADEYANNIDYTKTVKIFDCVPYHENCDVADMVAQAFLAGLKAGRPQWHDLEKDPNDLPKEDCQVITVGKSPRRLLIKKVAYYLRSEKKFTIWNKEYENFTNLHRVIAWCEIPTFDKE